MVYSGFYLDGIVMSFINVEFDCFKLASGFSDIKFIHYVFQVEINFNNSKELKISKPKVKLIDRREAYYKRWAKYYGF